MKMALRTRGLKVDTNYPRSGAVETSQHVFMNCVKATDCWRILGAMRDKVDSNDLPSWFEHQATLQTKEQMGEILCLLWRLWHERNEFL